MKSLMLFTLALLSVLSRAPFAESATLAAKDRLIRIAVMSQDDFHPDRTVPGNVPSLPPELAARLVERLTATGRFEVVERSALRRVLREQDFGKSRSASDLDQTIEAATANLPNVRGSTVAATAIAADYNDRLKEFSNLGSAVGADYLLYAVLEQAQRKDKTTAVPFSDSGRKVTRSELTSRLRFRLIESKGGTVVGAGSILDQAPARQLRERGGIDNRFAVFDHIAARTANQVLDIASPARLVSEQPWVVNRGSNESVTVGDRFRIEREGKAIKDQTGASLGKLRTQVGSARVTQVQPTFAVLEPVDGEFALNDLALRDSAADSAKPASAARVTVPPAAPAAATLPARPRLAVGYIKVHSTASTDTNLHTPIFTDTLISRLSQTGRFQMIDRQEVDQLLNEQQAQALAADRDMGAMGQLAGADYLLLGSISSLILEKRNITLPGSSRSFSRDGGHVEGNLRIVDARSGDVLASRKISLSRQLNKTQSQARLISELADDYADAVTATLMDTLYPIKVAAVVNGVAYINRGRDGGLKVGEVLRAVRPGAPIRDPDTGLPMGTAETELGEVTLAEVESARAKAPLGGVALARGDLLKRIADRPAAAPARTGGYADRPAAAGGASLTLAIGKAQLNPRGRNRQLRQANLARINNDLMVKFSGQQRFDVMERAEVDQLLDERTFSAIADDRLPANLAAGLQGADYLVTTVIDDFGIRSESTRVPYTDETQTRYFGNVEASLRLIDVHSGKLTGAIKVRIDEPLRNVHDMNAATNDLIDLFTSELVSQVAADLDDRAAGRSATLSRPSAPPPREIPKVNRPAF